MTYTLNYRNSFDEIKSMNTATNIDLVLSKDGLPFNLNNITDNMITIKIANQNGYIKDLSVDISSYTNEEKISGTFTLYLDDEFMRTFPPDIYYLEVWINSPNNTRIIFPSNDNILPFTINSNIVNGSEAIPMITFYQVKQDIEATKQLVLEHEAKIEKYINSLDARKDDVINDIDTKIQNYYKFSNNIKATLNSLNSKVFNESNNLNGKIDDISSNVSAATSAVNNAGNNVKNSVENIIISARSNINHDINTNSAINLINSGVANADSRINDVVTDAKSELISTASGLSNQITNLAKNGSKQINVTAGSAAANLTNMTRNTINTGSNVSSKILSAANSATTSVSDYTSSFDDNLAMATNSLDNFINDTKYSYSNLSNQVIHVNNTISDTANNATSYINDVKNSNTSQMVSMAVSNFYKSTGTNNTIPKSLDNLKETDIKLQSSITNNTSVINSHYNEFKDSSNNNNSLITVLSSSLSSNQDDIGSLAASNNTLSKSFSSLISESLVNNSNLSSTYNSYYNQAKSYTDSKLDKSSNSNESQNMKDYAVGNLVPITINNKEITQNGKTISIPVEEGKTYWFSCYVILGNGVSIMSDWIKDDMGYSQDIDTSIPEGTSGQIYKCKWVANQSGYMPINVNDYDDFKVCNICVTQSSTYVPFEVAERNRIGEVGLDLFKPNLLPITTLTDKIDREKYRVFNIPIKKGKTYWFSAKGENIEIHSPKDGNMNNVLVDQFNSNSDLYSNERINAFKWVSDRNGTLSFGFAGTYYDLSTVSLWNMCVTETKNYLPFEIAQENRENIQAVFNSIITTSK